MELTEVKQQIAAAGFCPVPVDAPAHESNSSAYLFLGTLDEYLQACKTLGVKAVLVEGFDLDAQYYMHEEVQRAELSRISPEVDLRRFEKKLRDFSPYIGKIGFVRYSAILVGLRLDYEIEEEWWTKYMEVYDRAISMAEDESARVSKEQTEATAATRNALFEKLRALSENQEFRKLPTQKAMLAYALDEIDGLNSIDTYKLKMEIQDMVAKLQAKRKTVVK